MDIKKKYLSNEYLYKPELRLHSETSMSKVIILHEQNHRRRCTAQSTAKGVFIARAWIRYTHVYLCVCLCYMHVCVFGEKGGRYGEMGKKMIRLRSRSKDDQRNHGNKKRLSKQFKMVLWLRLRMFTKALCVRLDMWKYLRECMCWHRKIFTMLFRQQNDIWCGIYHCGYNHSSGV